MITWNIVFISILFSKCVWKCFALMFPFVSGLALGSLLIVILIIIWPQFWVLSCLGSRDYHFIVPINVAWVLRRETQSGHQLNETMIVLHGNIMGDCPGGFCEYLLQFSEVLTVLLLADGFIFLVTLIPPLFSWKNKKPDSKNRIFFAVFSCLTFYFWLSVVALNSLYCFGFLSYAGPCNSSASSPASALG